MAKEPPASVLYTKHRDQKADKLWLEDFTKNYKELITHTFFGNWKEFASSEYFEQLAKNLHEKFAENPNLTGKIDSMQEYEYFLEFRYQRNLEKWFAQGLQQGILVEPKFLFIFDKNKRQKVLKKIESTQDEDAIIRYELLFFGITFEKTFVEVYGKSYAQTENEYGILKTFDLYDVISEEKSIAKTFSITEEVMGERKRQFIPYLVFSGNVGRVESGEIPKQKNLKEADEIDLISETIKIASKNEISKVHFLTHFFDSKTKGFKKEFQTLYDVIDKLEALKSSNKVKANKEGKYSVMGIETLFKNLDYKYCFFLHGKEYLINKKSRNARSISSESGNANPLLLSPAIFINSKIQGLALNCKPYLKYDSKTGTVNFEDFEAEFKKQLDRLIDEKIGGLVDKIYHSTELRLCSFREEVELGKSIWE